MLICGQKVYIFGILNLSLDSKEISDKVFSVAVASSKTVRPTATMIIVYACDCGSVTFICNRPAYDTEHHQGRIAASF